MLTRHYQSSPQLGHSTISHPSPRGRGQLVRQPILKHATICCASTLFKGVFKLLFYVVLPYGIMATVPAQFFTGTLTIPGFIYSIVIVIAFTAFTLAFWRLGLRCYKSASS
jgi:hypothetical protein